MVCGELGEELLVPGGDGDEGVGGAELEGKDGVAEVVPVDDEVGVAEEGHYGGDGEGGDGGGVLHEHVAGGRRGVAEGEVERPGLEEGFEGSEDGEEELGAGAEEVGEGAEGDDLDEGVGSYGGVDFGFWEM